MRGLADRLSSRLERRRPTSYALHELDLRIAKHLPRRNGVFVEVGANDGLAQSNTLFYERHRGWHGLLVEAIPELAARCRTNRPQAIVEQIALTNPELAGGSVTMRYCDLMSLINGAMGNAAREEDHLILGEELQGVETYDVAVPTTTISALLDKHALDHVDLFSLDVEGYEPEVLKGLDLDRHAPRAILVEAWDREAIAAQLDHRYRVVAELTEHGREVRGRPMAGDLLYLRTDVSVRGTRRRL